MQLRSLFLAGTALALTACQQPLTESPAQMAPAPVAGKGCDVAAETELTAPYLDDSSYLYSCAFTSPGQNAMATNPNAKLVLSTATHRFYAVPAR